MLIRGKNKVGVFDQNAVPDDWALMLDSNHVHLVLSERELNASDMSDGTEGTGYTYTGGKGGAAVLAMIEHDLTPFLIGQDAENVEALTEGMQSHIHYVGRGGIASFAISALDIALWDARGKRLGKPLVEMAGGAGTTTKAYGGGIDLNFVFRGAGALLETKPGARTASRQ